MELTSIKSTVSVKGFKVYTVHIDDHLGSDIVVNRIKFNEDTALRNIELSILNRFIEVLIKMREYLSEGEDFSIPGVTVNVEIEVAAKRLNDFIEDRHDISAVSKEVFRELKALIR